jgi:hypothetical protein
VPGGLGKELAALADSEDRDRINEAVRVLYGLDKPDWRALTAP